MGLSEAIDAIETSGSLDQLQRRFQRLVEDLGFASFALIDVGNPGAEDRFVIPTQDAGWADEYRMNGFVHIDPVVSFTRRTNVPFTWSDVPLPTRSGKRKPVALKLMEAAQDHGLRNGLVVPIHLVDAIGRSRSLLCVFFWKDMLSRFSGLLRGQRRDLHLLGIYFAQQAMDLTKREIRGARPAPDMEEAVSLTDRERCVLEWAARGKTVADTATILAVSGETVETHVRNSMRKLDAVNKTHAAVLAIKLGLIDV